MSQPLETLENSKFVKESKQSIVNVIFGRSMVVAFLLIVQILLLFALFYRFARYAPYYVGATLVFTAGMLLYVLNTRGNPSMKLSWCILIAVLPVFGALLYVYVRNDLGHRMEQRLLHYTFTESVPYIPDQSAVMGKLKTENRSLYNLASYTLKYSGCPAYGNTTVRYFPLGEDKFAEMLVQLEKAEKFIFLEYFIIGEGYMWGSVLDILERKAQAGVEVRLMYDGTCAFSSLPYNYPREMEKRGIRCKMFSPIRPMVSTHYNNRDHRKILVIDGHTAFTGGVNLEDRYINRQEVYGHWKDTAVMVQGDAARSFTLMFLQMWNATERQRVYAPYLNVPIPRQEGAVGYVLPYGDSPLDREKVGEMVYLNMLHQARDYVYIMTPYLILDNEMVTALRFAAGRGVDVRIILPHIPDKKYAFMLAKTHYQELTEAGVKIYEYTPGFVHAKVFLVDGREAVVGTINLDYRSLYHHFECAAYLSGVPALKDIRADFAHTLSLSHEITTEDIKNRPLKERLLGGLLKVAAPLM